MLSAEKPTGETMGVVVVAAALGRTKAFDEPEEKCSVASDWCCIFIIFLVVFPSEKGENVQMQGKAMKRRREGSGR